MVNYQFIRAEAVKSAVDTLLWWDTDETSDNQNAFYTSPADDPTNRTLITGTDVSDRNLNCPDTDASDDAAPPTTAVDLLARVAADATSNPFDPTP